MSANVQMPAGMQMCECSQICKFWRMLAHGCKCPHLCECRQMWAQAHTPPQPLSAGYHGNTADISTNTARAAANLLLYRRTKKMRKKSKKIPKKFADKENGCIFVMSNQKKGAAIAPNQGAFFLHISQLYAAFYPRAYAVMAARHLS